MITVFNFEENNIRFVGTPDNPWWVAVDICAAVKVKNPSQAIDRLDDDERSMLNIGRQGEAWCINESGLYSLILTSRKPEARRFKKWVTSEVLPSIRKTGQFMIATPPEPQPALTQIQILAALAQQMAEQEQRILEQEQRQKEVLARLEAVEVEQDRYLAPCGHKYSIMGFAKLQGVEISTSTASAKGRKASALCRKENIAVERIHDPRFGYVGLYPESVLVQVFSST